MELSGKRVAVVGLARSGIAAARLAHRLGGRVFASEHKKADKLAATVEELSAAGIDVEAGGHERLAGEKFDIVVLSPGVVPKAEWLTKWSQDSTVVWSEIELASRAFSGSWIGVTGSNGKSTTVTLIHTILAAAGYDVEAAGNIGSAWSEFMPAKSSTTFVVELSSYQLERCPTIRPRVGVLLNLFENHLDRHVTMAEYARAKANLFANHTADDFAVINGENDWSGRVAGELRSKIVRFGTSDLHDFWFDAAALWYRERGKVQRLLERSEFPLPGEHNVMNALAASAASLSFGAGVESVRRGLRNARPVEHRIEYVATKQGIRYFNDSKSTNLTATLTAIRSFDSNVILIFGGRPKVESYVNLADKFPVPIKKMISYGEANDRVKSDLSAALDIEYFMRFDEAVQRAATLATPGDTVLLSPGCASFDQFSDFEERGRHFKELVNSLP